MANPTYNLCSLWPFSCAEVLGTLPGKEGKDELVAALKDSLSIAAKLRQRWRTRNSAITIKGHQWRSSAEGVGRDCVDERLGGSLQRCGDVFALEWAVAAHAKK